jgi:hypothetical protein
MKAGTAWFVVALVFITACGGEAPPAASPAAPAPTASAASATPSASAPAPAPAAGETATAPPPNAALFMAVRARQPVSSGLPSPEATKHDGCKAHGGLPDSACTPGAVMTTDLDVICHESTKNRRKVTSAVHKQAFTEYGYTFPQTAGAFEVDHFIPLELGGDNTIENLWAEPASPKPGFHEKDHVEDYLHKQVCSGAMTLEEAQKAITTDWLSVWKKMNAGGDDGEETGADH